MAELGDIFIDVLKEAWATWKKAFVCLLLGAVLALLGFGFFFLAIVAQSLGLVFFTGAFAVLATLIVLAAQITMTVGLIIGVLARLRAR